MSEQKIKEKNRYIFPNKLASAMKRVDQRTQHEASLLSMSLLMLGMFLYVLYLILYGKMNGWEKGILIFNMVCGFAFLGTYLITTYQQYTAYMEAMGLDSDREKEATKKRGNIFKRIREAISTHRKMKKMQKMLSLESKDKSNNKSTAKFDELMEKSGVANDKKSKEVNEELDEIEKEAEELLNNIGLKTKVKGGSDN